MPHEKLRQAIKVAKENVQAEKGGPFGACLVTLNACYVAANHVVPNIDVTSHAEVNAFRAFIKNQGYSLLEPDDKPVLFSSCECCPMCMAMAITIGIAEIIYASTREDAESIGFDDNLQYKLLKEKPISKLTFSSEVIEILNQNKADFLLLDDAHNLIVSENSAQIEDLGLISVSGIRKACKKLKSLSMPKGSYIITKKIPHPMGLIAADWAKILRNENDNNLNIICATKEYEKAYLKNKKSDFITIDNAELIYDIFAGDKKNTVEIHRTQNQQIIEDALNTFSLFAQKIKNNKAIPY